MLRDMGYSGLLPVTQREGRGKIQWPKETRRACIALTTMDQRRICWKVFHAQYRDVRTGKLSIGRENTHAVDTH